MEIMSHPRPDVKVIMTRLKELFWKHTHIFPKQVSDKQYTRTKNVSLDEN